MSSPFDTSQSSAEHFRERQQEKLLDWGERVFAEPTAEGNGINPRLYELGYISREQEIALYKDLHSRDSEVGLGLIDWRKAELLDAIAFLKSAVKKREHAAALVRSRREALDRLTTGAQVVAEGFYAQPQAELASEMEKIDLGLNFLRSYSSKIDALERIVRLVGSETALRVTRSSEQMLRLFSQSWRGLVKIKAWENHFEDAAHQPALQPFKQPGEPAGLLLPLGDNMRAVAISYATAGYLLHLLEGINSLAETYRANLISGENPPSASWGKGHTLIRAIVELFYFCNFEMPFSYVDLAIDPEDPSQICSYNYETGQWQVTTEDADSSRTIKRVGAEAAQLLINSCALLKCRRDDDLNIIIDEEAEELKEIGESQTYRLFMCSGLSEFDLDPASQRIKFRMAFSSMSQLLASVAAGQDALTLVSGSALGGPLETVLGMALLDARAFSLPEGVKGLDAIGRFQMLSSFWRTLGRRRAIAMLGENYVKSVTNGLASLGEQGPDHPTFLTMRAGTVFGMGAGNPAAAAGSGKSKSNAETVEQSTVAPPILSPFTTVGLSDQIRLLDLAVQSWKMAEELLEKLRDVHSQGKLKRVIESLPAVVGTRKEDIQMRFNAKWLVASNWQWTFMRTCTPVAWDFWTKISSDEPWDDVILGLHPYQALSLLLRLFSDVVRLLLVIELSGSEIAESLSVEAESAGQEIMRGLEGFFKEGERLPPQVAEAINFYYDPDVRFDSWLAFTSSFRRYLQQMGTDLKSLNVDEQLLATITSISDQIEILYPVRETVETKALPIEVAEPDINPNNLFIDEAESQRIEYLLTNLLNAPEQDNWTFLKMLSLAARSDKRGLLALASAHSDVVIDLLPENSQRALLFNTPGTARKFFSFLNRLGEEGAPTEDALNEMRPQMHDYFQQLNEIYDGLVPLTNQIPHILPDDHKRLFDYLKNAPAKSSGLNFLLQLACNRLVLDISDFEEPSNVQAERAEAKVRAFMREELQASIEEPSVEIYPIGSGNILARRGQIILSASGEGFDPIWNELTQPRSQSLYARFISNKIALTSQLLKHAFPDYLVLVR